MVASHSMSPEACDTAVLLCVVWWRIHSATQPRRTGIGSCHKKTAVVLDATALHSRLVEHVEMGQRGLLGSRFLAHNPISCSSIRNTRDDDDNKQQQQQ